MEARGCLEWIPILLAVIAALLGILVWQFIGDDVGLWWQEIAWRVDDRMSRTTLARLGGDFGWGVGALVFLLIGAVITAIAEWLRPKN